MNIRTVIRHKKCKRSSRLDRPLVELEEYAKREGITPADVRKCSDIGIIQLRSHRGRTFVVDIPVCSYDHTEQIDDQVAELLGLIHKSGPLEPEKIFNQTPKSENAHQTRGVFSSVKKLANKLSNSKTHTKSKTENNAEPPPAALPPSTARFEPGAISELVQEMLRRAEEIKAQDRKSAEQNLPEIVALPQKQSCKATKDVLTSIQRRLDEIEHRSAKYKNVRTQTPDDQKTSFF